MESTDGLLFHLGMPAARFAHAAAASAASGSLENMVCGLMHCPLCILAPTPSLPPQLLLSRNPSKGAPRICSGRTRGSQDTALSCARVPVATDDAGNTPEARRRGLPPPKPPPPPAPPLALSPPSSHHPGVGPFSSGPPPQAVGDRPLPPSSWPPHAAPPSSSLPPETGHALRNLGRRPDSSSFCPCASRRQFLLPSSPP
mmetsp:Transcript_32574/g.84298  ORF Transcript_32574/g.84298 Transcript_32574/m.84298 type:complete len:200 (-) Transcript_32574:618-1217(-)